MSVTLEPHGDILRVRLSHWRSRAVGYEVSAYIYRDTLIDTGFPAVSDELAAVAFEHRVAGALLTHHHEDHSGGVGALTAQRLPVGMSPLTRQLMRELRVPFYRRVVWGSIGRRPELVAPYVPSGLTLLAAPGHSIDHHVVWDAEHSTMFGGDLWLGVKVRVAHPGEDPRLHARTLRAIAALRPDRFFDGHRGLVPNASGAMIAKAVWLESMIAAIDDRINFGWTDKRIASELLGREPVTRWVSNGEYSKRMFVTAVRNSRTAGGGR
jgi:glyoxylase-like metal-dependent hydrolase (beta-lactamase superfamily II)